MKDKVRRLKELGFLGSSQDETTVVASGYGPLLTNFVVSAQLDAENNDSRQTAEIMIVSFFILFPLFLSLELQNILISWFFRLHFPSRFIHSL